jgi:hypothetical protein
LTAQSQYRCLKACTRPGRGLLKKKPSHFIL